MTTIPLSKVALLEPGEQICQTKGTLIGIGERKEGTGQFGAYTIQDITIKDGDATMKVAVWHHEPILDSWKGKVVWLIAQQKKRGVGTRGLEVELNEWQGRQEKLIKLGKEGEIVRADSLTPIDTQATVVPQPDKPAASQEPPTSPAISERPATTTALATRTAATTALPAVTTEQARTDAVSGLISRAYLKVSEVPLTAGEVKKLKEDFGDEAFRTGAAGEDNLIYIEHPFLRDRLNDVIGMGQWALVVRKRWAEDFLTSRQEQASRVYVDAVLLIRGAFFSEAIGDMVYYKSNPKVNYGDAVEGAESAALRRALKKQGIGQQPWKKGFVEGWLARKRQGMPGAPKPQPGKQAATKRVANDKTRDWMIEQLRQCEDLALEYFTKLTDPKVLSFGQTLKDLPLEFVPINRAQMDNLLAAITDFETGAEAYHSFPPNPKQ